MVGSMTLDGPFDDAPGHHLVSRGLQRNFAPNHRVAVIDVSTGAVIDSCRAIKSNQRVEGFNSYQGPDGRLVHELEDEWARIERVALNRVRELERREATQEHRGAVIELFAMHLVRSQAFEDSRRNISDILREEEPPKYEDDEALKRAFAAGYGRPPQPGEIAALARSQLDEMESSRRARVDSMVRNYNGIADRLSKYSIQLVTIVDDRLPGFLLGDVPVVHADLNTNRYGFRDRLAIGDSNFVFGPISRRLAVCLSASPRRHVRLSIRGRLDDLNSVTWLAAMREVYCDPADQRAASQMKLRVKSFDPKRLQEPRRWGPAR